MWKDGIQVLINTQDVFMKTQIGKFFYIQDLAEDGHTVFNF